MQRLAFHQRMRKQHCAERLVAQVAHGRPCAAQMLMGAGAVRKHHGLIVGIQEHFTRPGQLLRPDTQQGRFIQRDACQSAAHAANREMRAALLDALRQGTVIAQPRCEIGSATECCTAPEFIRINHFIVPMLCVETWFLIWQGKFVLGEKCRVDKRSASTFLSWHGGCAALIHPTTIVPMSCIETWFLKWSARTCLRFEKAATRRRAPKQGWV